MLAARELRRQGALPPPAFTWLPPCDDSPPSAAHTQEYVRIHQIAARERLPVYHCQSLRPEDVISNLRQDGTFPRADFIEAQVQRQAANLGLRVLLSGLGGDEGVSFNGRGYDASLLLCGRWRRFAAECFARKENPIRVGARIALQIGNPRFYHFLVRRRLGRSFFPSGRRWFIHPDFKRSVRPLPDGTWVRNIGVRRTQLRLLQDGHLSQFLEQYAGSGARHGIEYRHPLLDRRLLEFALGLPPNQFRRGRWNRWLMRSALRSVLPSAVCWREEESAFEPSLIEPMRETYFKAYAILRQEIVVRAETMSRARYVDVPKLLNRLDANCPQDRPKPGAINRVLIFLDL